MQKSVKSINLKSIRYDTTFLFALGFVVTWCVVMFIRRRLSARTIATKNDVLQTLIVQGQKWWDEFNKGLLTPEIM